MQTVQSEGLLMCYESVYIFIHVCLIVHILCVYVHVCSLVHAGAHVCGMRNYCFMNLDDFALINSYAIKS